MDDCILYEIYLLGFKVVVQEGGVYVVMVVYNKFRGDYCVYSEYLFDELLKDQFGFDGVVISDWNVVKFIMEVVKVGIDLEMGLDLFMLVIGNVDYGKFYMGDIFVIFVQNGMIDEELINKKVCCLL